MVVIAAGSAGSTIGSSYDVGAVSLHICLASNCVGD